MKPRLLDLFAGQGGAARGYQDAGFYVVGVDIRPMPRYCGDEFFQADALEVLDRLSCGLSLIENDLRYHIEDFSAVHSSPPCQFFSATTPEAARANYEDLITPTRRLLMATKLPYVIENVERARPYMDAPLTICGSSLGLKVRRHRLFETNWPLIVPPCAHGQQGQPVGVYGEGSSKGQKRGRKADNEAEVLEVMGMPWADRAGATQAIPPLYAELIGHQLMQHLERKAA